MSGLVGFEVGVLRQFNFNTIALPFGGDGKLGWSVKAFGKRVLTNDILQSDAWRAVARVENNGFQLSAAQIEDLTTAADRHAEHGELLNSGLLRWFQPRRARWLEGFRSAALDIGERPLKGAAMSLGMSIGDYLLSFDGEIEELRLPVEEVVPILASKLKLAIDNRQENRATNLDPHQFAVQFHADLVYAAFPSPAALSDQAARPDGWREVWAAGRPDAWETLVFQQRGRFGGALMTKQRYFEVVRGFLKRLRHFPQWAISVSEPGDVSLQDVKQAVEEFRTVIQIFTKDTSEFIGGKTQHVIVTRA